MGSCHSLEFIFHLFGQCVNNNNNINMLEASEITEKNSENNFKYYGLIFSVGFLIALMLDAELIKKHLQTAFKLVLKKIFSVFGLLISLIIIPTVFIIIPILSTYRTTIHFILKYQLGSKYKGFFKDTDTVWAIEDATKCVINVLAVVQTNNVDEFKQKLTEKLNKITKDEHFAKLRYYRQMCYGYFIWKEENFSVADHIDYLKPIESHEENTLNRQELLQILSETVNKTLPKDHVSSWEILIGKQKLKTDKNNENNYPVLFRFHHSLGDGIALIKILLKAVGSKINAQPKQIKTNDKTPKPVKKITISLILHRILSIISAPAHLIELSILRPVDKNILHGKELNGGKTLAWISEDDDFALLETVKYIKSKFPGVSFFDVVLTAFTQALHKYFEEKSAEIPHSITVAIPERLENLGLDKKAKNATNQMQNLFTVAMVSLPILSPPQSGSTGVDTNDSGIGSHYATATRLQEISRNTTMLKTVSNEYQLNYWVLKMGSKFAPVPILRPLIRSKHCTAAISNILGPQEVKVCDSFIKDVIFWVPHKELTGVGLSVMSYAGKLQLGLSVDKALMSSAEEVDLILRNIVKSLKLFGNELRKIHS